MSDTSYTPPDNAINTPSPSAPDAPGYPDGTVYLDADGVSWVILVYDYNADGVYSGWHKIPTTAPTTGS
jgi:hypothetical protein